MVARQHGCQTDRILHNTLSTRPARCMVTRQTQYYMTHCRQNPHKAWSPDRHNITRHTVDKTRTKHGRQTDTTNTQHTVDKTRTKHGRQTDTTIHDTLSTTPAQSMVARQTQQIQDTLSTRPARSMVARQTQQIHDTLLTRPARSMVARQTQHYTTHCRQEPHEAWSPDRHNNT